MATKSTNAPLRTVVNANQDGKSAKKYRAAREADRAAQQIRDAREAGEPATFTVPTYDAHGNVSGYVEQTGAGDVVEQPSTEDA